MDSSRTRVCVGVCTALVQRCSNCEPSAAENRALLVNKPLTQSSTQGDLSAHDAAAAVKLRLLAVPACLGV